MIRDKNSRHQTLVLMLSQDAITIQQAAIALACFSGETEIVVAAKKEIGPRLAQEIYDYFHP